MCRMHGLESSAKWQKVWMKGLTKVFSDGLAIMKKWGIVKMVHVGERVGSHLVGLVKGVKLRCQNGMFFQEQVISKEGVCIAEHTNGGSVHLDPSM